MTSFAGFEETAAEGADGVRLRVLESTVAVNALNLRASASKDSAVVAVMPRGAGVTLTGQRANGFVSVTYQGASGWAYESYLNVGATPSPDPDPAPQPNQPHRADVFEPAISNILATQAP